MGRRRSRNTAKTGDRALYRAGSGAGGGGDGEAPTANNGKIGGVRARGDADDDEDRIHDEVDRYHLSRSRREEEELIRLDDDVNGSSAGEEDDDGIVKNREGVFDLGVGASSSSDDESEDESSDEEEGGGAGNEDRLHRGGDDDHSPSSSSSSSDDDSSSSSSDEDDGDGEPTTIGDVLDWGRSKRAYYQTAGDTDPTLRPGAAGSDDEDVDEKDDAILEEEAGREVQRLRLKDMDEDDFLEDFADAKGGGGGAAEGDVPPPSKGGRKTSASATAGDGLFEAFDGFAAAHDGDDVDVMDSSTPNLAEMTPEERLERLTSAHPEFVPLVRHFAESALSPLATDGPISVASRHLLTEEERTGGGDDGGQAEAVGATPGGLEYLRTKRLILVSTVLNLVSYLLLKRDSVRNGNDGKDTVDIRSHPVIARLNELQGLNDTLRERVEVPFGLDGQLDSLRKAAELMMNDGDGDDDDAEESEEEDTDESSSGGPRGTDDVAAPAHAQKVGTVSSTSSSDEEVDAAGDEGGGESATAAALNEARFAVRWGEDFDEGGDDYDGVQKKRRKKKRSRRATANAEKRCGVGEGDYGDDDDGEDALRASRALSATVNSIAQRERTRDRRRRPAPDADGGDADTSTNEDGFRGVGMEAMDEEEMLGKASGGEGGDGEDDDDVDREIVDDASEDDAYYDAVKKRTRAKKAGKRVKYAVAPKYPSIEEEVRGERAASKTIMKNRGLVPHKNKLARNPRVKKREQYRKALIRRRGAVRDLRKPEEGERYGGELTGIKTCLSRSRKLGVR